MPTKKHFWRTGVGNFLVQVALLAILWLFLPNILIPSQGIARYILLLTLVSVPGAVWALFFYFQDKKTPEPLPALFNAFWLGISSAVIVFIPLTTYIFRLPEWLFSDMKMFLLGSVFIYSPIIVIVFYALLRLVFYPLADLDEPIDGMVYGSFIGAGFACAKSLVQLSTAGDFTIFYGLYIASVHTIVFASVGACVGYFVGKSKFDKKALEKNALLALISGSILVSLYQFVNEYILLSGVTHAYEISFVLSAVFGLLILGWCYYEMRKLAQSGEFKHIKAQPGIERTAHAMMMATLLIATLVTLFAVKNNEFDNGILRFEYASQYKSYTSFGAVTYSAEGKILFSVSDRNSTIVCLQTSSGDSMTGEPIQVLPTSMTVTSWMMKNSTIKRYDYGYLKENDKSLPTLYWVRHDVIIHGNEAFIFVFSALPHYYYQTVPLYEKMLATLTFPD